MFEKGHAFYLMYGSQSNGAGQNIISKFFVVNLDKDGHFSENPVSFYDFLSAHPSFSTSLYQAGASQSDIDVLSSNLDTAINVGIQLYMRNKQSELSGKMEQQRKNYSDHLEQWYKRSEKQMSLDLGDTPTTIQRKNIEKKIEEIKTIADKESDFYQNLTTLDNSDPYIKVLAVFYNFES